MDCEIQLSRNISKRFEKRTRQILSLFGPNIKYGDQNGKVIREYKLRFPVNKIFLLNESEFNESKRESGSDYELLKTGYEPSPESYQRIPTTGDFNWKSFYQKEKERPLDTSLAYWRPIFGRSSSMMPYERDFDSFVYVCIDSVIKTARSLRKRLPEIDSRFIEGILFKIVLIHEIGHHYTFANFKSEEVKEIMRLPDLNILEGLANWQTNMFLTKEEKWVQAEMAIDQRPSYRHYLYFKHCEMSALLDCFFSIMDYSKAPLAMKHVIGGQHNLNGFMMAVGGKYDGIAMDWSDKGGSIIAEDGMKGLATMRKGFFITPRIEFLIGRFPKDTIVITNEIVNIFDYGILPQNVMVISKDQKDIKKIIQKNKSENLEIRLNSILDEIGIEYDPVKTAQYSNSK